MALFNFTIYYQLEVKIGYIDFASRIETFLFKDSTSILTSTLRKQKQSDYSQLKWTKLLSELTITKKQKQNPIVFFRKIEYIRKRKTHNGHYCQQCHIYYQGYNHRCSTPQYYNDSPIISEGEGWINPNSMIVKAKSLK